MKNPKIFILIVFFLITQLSFSGAVFAFTGPTLPAGQGGGTLQLDGSGNIGFGTNLATPTGDPTNAVFGRVFTIASTSDPGIALRNLSIGGGKYIIYSRANGRFVVWDDVAIRPRFFIESNGNVGISGNSTSFFTPSSTLHVAGSIQTDAAFVGQLAPSSITGGAFQATNYAFPSALGVGTSSIAGLPTGGLYVAGNVGIGTKSPGVKLHLYDAINNAQIKLESDGSDDSSDILIDRPNSQRRSDIYFTTADVTDWVIGTLYNGGAANSKFSISSDSTLANSKFVIDTNGNVGIGTTAPGSELHVKTTDGSAYLTIENSGGTAGPAGIDLKGTRGAGADSDIGRIRSYWDGNNVAEIRFDTGVDTTNKDDGSIQFFTSEAGSSPAERLRIQPSGNVGIGTTGPQAKLTVSRSTHNSTLGGASVLQITDAPSSGEAVGNRAEINFYTNTDSLPANLVHAGIGIVKTSAVGNEVADLYFNVASVGGTSAERMRITSSGNVGIGTATPAQKLSVAGVIESTTGGFKFPDGSIQLTAGGGGNSVGWSRTGTYVTLTTTTDWVAIGTTTPTQALHVQGNAYVSGNIVTGGTMTTNVGASNVSAGTFGTTAGKGNYTFEAAASTNNVLKVDATNERVGIGTGSPASILSVVGGSGTVPTLSLGANLTQSSFQWNPNGNERAVIISGASGVNGYGSIITSSNDTEGNGQALGYFGFAQTVSGKSTANAGLKAAIGAVTSGAGGTSGGYGGDLVFYTRPDNYGNSFPYVEAMRIDRNGGVGIGTASPTAKLDVRGNVNLGTQWANTDVQISGASGWALTLHGDSAYSSIIDSRGYLALGSNGTEKVRIGSTGNVGIGTGTTTEALTINKSSGKTGIRLEGNGTDVAEFYVSSAGVNHDTYLGTVANNPLYIQTSGSVRMTIGSNTYSGYVGIATTTPTEALTVQGNIKATGNVIAGGTMTANVSAPNVSAGTFGTTAGKGNYTFEAAANTNNVLKVDATNERVGVGESGPTTALDVKKDVPAASGTAPILLVGNKSGNWGNYAMIETRNVPDGRAVRFGSYLGSSSYAQGGFAVVTGVNGDIASTPTTKFFVRHDGNVGIGTVSPTAYLHVRGDASAQPIMVKFENSGNGNYLGFANQYGASNRMAITQNADLKITLGESGGVGILTGSADIPSGVINLNGNVGIGTTNPGTNKLHIYNGSSGGTAYQAGGLVVESNTRSAIQLLHTNSNDAYLFFGDVNAGNRGYIGHYGSAMNPANLMIYYSVGNHAFTGGNVGIGTTTPSYLLHVNGTAKFENPVEVGSPSASNHATTKSYVDSLLTGGTTSGNLSTLIVTGTTTLASTAGKVTIGGAGPSLKLDVTGQGQFTDTLSATKYYDYNDPTYYIDPANTGTSLKLGGSIQSDGSGTSYVLGNTLIGTASNPGSYKFAVSGTSYFSNQVTVNANLLLGTSQNITLQTGNITGVNKITAAIIDPLYEIDGKKYATYASSIAGGLYEEFIGRGNLEKISNSQCSIFNQDSNTNDSIDTSLKTENCKLQNYAYIIDFNKVERGSDLWLWYQVVDFGEDTVQAIVTSIGESANIYYEIQGKKIIFKTDNLRPTTYNGGGIKFSFRLSGKRHDYKEWPTEAKDQKEKASFILKAK